MKTLNPERNCHTSFNRVQYGTSKIRSLNNHSVRGRAAAAATPRHHGAARAGGCLTEFFSGAIRAVNLLTSFGQRGVSRRNRVTIQLRNRPENNALVKREIPPGSQRDNINS